MKRTQLSDLFANIKATWISFLSIIIFIALGIGIYVGFDWSGLALRETLHTRFEEGDLHDIELLYPYGIEESELAELRAVEGVDALDTRRIGSAFFEHGEDYCQAKLVTLPQEIDRFLAVEGRLPKRDNEIAVERGSADTLGIKVGDTVTLKRETAEVTVPLDPELLALGEAALLPETVIEQDITALRNLELRVTAIVESSEYISISASSYGVSSVNGLSVNAVFFVRDSAFREGVVPSINSVLLRRDALRGSNTFSEEYEDASHDFKASIEPIAEKIGSRSYDAWKEKNDASDEPADADNAVTVSIRSNNIGYIYAKLIADIVLKLRYSLGGLFLILGLLVCYSVITRMINDQRKLIGTKKANGFRQREITALYLSYNALAGLIGSALGWGLAAFAVEPFLTPYLDGTFTSPCMTNYYSVNSLSLLVGELLLILLVSYCGCRYVLRLSAVELLRGESVASWKERFYERGILWNRLPVLTQTVVNNTLKDGRRVFATLVGIAGCTALLVSSVTLRNDVLKSFHSQYEQYYHFDCIVYYDSETEGARGELEKVFDRRGVHYASVYRTDGYAYCDDCPKKLTALTVFNDRDSFSKLVQLDSCGESGEYDYRGMWLPESLKYHYALSEHPTAHYENFAGEKAEAELTGFYKAYSYNLTCYMDSDTYETLFDKAYEPNAFLIDASNAEQEELRAALCNVAGYTQTYEYYRSDREDAAIFEIIARAMVGVYLAASVLMAVFVILNLLSSFVAEKKTEITVLLVNGCSVRQGRRYVSLDTLLLTAVGIALGLFGGIAMGNVSIASFESEYIRILHEVNESACLLGAAVSAALTLAMSVIAFRGIGKFSLSEINRQ